MKNSKINLTIRFIPLQSELGLIQTKFSIRMNPRLKLFVLNIQARIKAQWIGYIQIEAQWIGLSLFDFCPSFIKRDTKHFSDWFRIVSKQISKWFEIALIRSDWIRIRNFRQCWECRFKDWFISCLDRFKLKRGNERRLSVKLSFYCWASSHAVCMKLLRAPGTMIFTLERIPSTIHPFHTGWVEERLSHSNLRWVWTKELPSWFSWFPRAKLPTHTCIPVWIIVIISEKPHESYNTDFFSSTKYSTKKGTISRQAWTLAFMTVHFILIIIAFILNPRI